MPSSFIPITIMEGTNKRNRWMLNSHQNKILSSIMEYNAFPDKLLREKLALELDLPDKVIQVWFQNKRQQCRRKINSPQFTFINHSSPPLAPKTNLILPSRTGSPSQIPKQAISKFSPIMDKGNSDIDILALAAEISMNSSPTLSSHTSMATTKITNTTKDWERTNYPWGGECLAENTSSEPNSLS